MTERKRDSALICANQIYQVYEKEEQLIRLNRLSPILCMPFVHSRSSVFPGELLSFEKLIIQIFDFINAMCEQKALRKAIKGHLDELMSLIIAYLPMTDDQVNELMEWKEKMDAQNDGHPAEMKDGIYKPFCLSSNGSLSLSIVLFRCIFSFIESTIYGYFSSY